MVTTIIQQLKTLLRVPSTTYKPQKTLSEVTSKYHTRIDRETLYDLFTVYKFCSKSGLKNIANNLEYSLRHVSEHKFQTAHHLLRHASDNLCDTGKNKEWAGYEHYSTICRKRIDKFLLQLNKTTES